MLVSTRKSDSFMIKRENWSLETKGIGLSIRQNFAVSSKINSFLWASSVRSSASQNFLRSPFLTYTLVEGYFILRRLGTCWIEARNLHPSLRSCELCMKHHTYRHTGLPGQCLDSKPWNKRRPSFWALHSWKILYMQHKFRNPALIIRWLQSREESNFQFN